MGLSNKKSALRRGSIADMNGYGPQKAWEPPPLEECDPEDVVPIPLNETARVTERFLRKDGRIVDYALMLDARQDGEDWSEVARIDCCHAEVHIHQYYRSRPGTRDVIRPIRSQEDVEDSVDSSLDLIFGNWDRMIRKWRFGHE